MQEELEAGNVTISDKEPNNGTLETIKSDDKNFLTFESDSEEQDHRWEVQNRFASMGDLQ